jgi:hypothetical protein
VRSAIYDGKWWRISQRYEIWGSMYLEFYPFSTAVAYARTVVFPDQWAEDFADMMGAYCAGGEL